MIAKRLIGYLKLSDGENLKNKSSKYTWAGQGDEEMDGPRDLVDFDANLQSFYKSGCV